LTSGICIPLGAGIFLFATISRPSLVPTQPAIPVTLYPEVKQL
jgi:hypothetical protein